MAIEATEYESSNHPRFSAVQIANYKTDCWIVRDTSGRCSFYDIETCTFGYGDIRDYRLPKDVALNILRNFDINGGPK